MAMRALFKAPALRSVLRVPTAQPSAIVRSLHTTRKTFADASLDTYKKQVESFHKLRTKSQFVLEAPAVTTWYEIPRGGPYAGLSYKETVWKIWYNHAIVPLYGVLGLATGLMCFFMYKYFSQHTEIAWSKSMRGTFDHTGLDERKANSHSNRLLYPGMRERNKRDVNIFPFNFVPMNKIAEKRFVDYNGAGEE